MPEKLYQRLDAVVPWKAVVDHRQKERVNGKMSKQEKTKREKTFTFVNSTPENIEADELEADGHEKHTANSKGRSGYRSQPFNGGLKDGKTKSPSQTPSKELSRPLSMPPTASQAALSSLQTRAQTLWPLRKQLPVWKHSLEIRHSLRINNVLLVSGATGSGKSTQIPQMLLTEQWLLPNGRIAVTEPRRVAAISLARRVAEEMGTSLGGKVGYSVRFDNRVGNGCRVKFLTEGMLLREVLRDHWLKEYDVVIVDEVHERGVDVDVMLGFLKRILEGGGKGRDGRLLRVVVMSATADIERLCKFFGSEKGGKEASATNEIGIGDSGNRKSSSDGHLSTSESMGDGVAKDMDVSSTGIESESSGLEVETCSAKGFKSKSVVSSNPSDSERNLEEEERSNIRGGSGGEEETSATDVTDNESDWTSSAGDSESEMEREVPNHSGSGPSNGLNTRNSQPQAMRSSKEIEREDYSDWTGFSAAEEIECDVLSDWTGFSSTKEDKPNEISDWAGFSASEDEENQKTPNKRELKSSPLTNGSDQLSHKRIKLLNGGSARCIKSNGPSDAVNDKPHNPPPAIKNQNHLRSIHLPHLRAPISRQDQLRLHPRLRHPRSISQNDLPNPLQGTPPRRHSRLSHRPRSRRIPHQSCQRSFPWHGAHSPKNPSPPPLRRPPPLRPTDRLRSHSAGNQKNHHCDQHCRNFYHGPRRALRDRLRESQSQTLPSPTQPRVLARKTHLQIGSDPAQRPRRP